MLHRKKAKQFCPYIIQSSLFGFLRFQVFSKRATQTLSHARMIWCGCCLNIRIYSFIPKILVAPQRKNNSVDFQTLASRYDGKRMNTKLFPPKMWKICSKMVGSRIFAQLWWQCKAEECWLNNNSAKHWPSRSFSLSLGYEEMSQAHQENREKYSINIVCVQ